MKIKEALKVKVGDTIKLSKQPSYKSLHHKSTGHYVYAGEAFEVEHIEYSTNTVRFHCKGLSNGDYLTAGIAELVSTKAKEVTKMEELEQERTKLEVQIDELKKESKLIDIKITYLLETESEEFNETEFKSYQILKLIDQEPHMQLSEKAKLIASIVDA